MELRSFKVSVPGSMMLMGEHAVLERKQALVCGIEKRITVTVSNQPTDNIVIYSDRLGECRQPLNKIDIIAPFGYVLRSVKLFENYLQTGLFIKIHSDFSERVGFGSSAAVTAATIAALTLAVHGKPYSKQMLFQEARKVILAEQGQGSCADLAASIYGGVLAYRVEPFKIESLPKIPGFTAVYCGYKKTTRLVLEMIEQAKQLQPKIYEAIFQCIDECTQRAIWAIKQQDWETLGQLFMHHQGLQYAMGVSNYSLETLIDQLLNHKDILGAKISGSGLGDCIVGLGRLPRKVFPQDQAQQAQGVQQFDLSIAEQGIQYESVQEKVS